MLRILQNSRSSTIISLGLIFGGLLIDLTTSQELVVAIVYDIPIVLSALTQSRRVTRNLILIAVAANIAAAYVNAMGQGSFDSITLLNRSLSLIALLMVGGLVLLFKEAAVKVHHLQYEVAWAAKERLLRNFTADLAGSSDKETLLQRAAELLRSLLKADRVVISKIDASKFTEPGYANPDHSELMAPGADASWALEVLPDNDYPVTTLRTATTLVTIGRLSQVGNDTFLIIVQRPDEAQASKLLTEALQSMTLILRRFIKQ
jgi:K+-sensing histidine kinase KdpD